MPGVLDGPSEVIRVVIAVFQSWIEGGRRNGSGRPVEDETAVDRVDWPEGRGV